MAELPTGPSHKWSISRAATLVSTIPLCENWDNSHSEVAMAPKRGHLGIRVSERAGIGYNTQGTEVPFLAVGSCVPPDHAANLGIRPGILTDRHIAFFLLLVLDRDGELGSRSGSQNDSTQRVKFAERLGVPDTALRRWLARALAARPGRILNWRTSGLNGRASRTGGPWQLDVESAIVVPDANAGLAFVEQQRVAAALRQSDPASLLKEAMQTRDAGHWIDALGIFEEAEEMFRRRRWSRKEPLRFEIFLQLAQTEMQLGNEGLRPNTAANTLRSVTKQNLGGAAADLVRARAHYIAALVSGQRDDVPTTSTVLSHIERSCDALRGYRGDVALREYWRAVAFREETLARVNGIAQPRHSSAILHASRLIEGGAEQKRMSYGASLLDANRPAEALNYILPALDSGRLAPSALVIAKRANIVCQWRLGARPGPTLKALDQLEEEASAFGFAHQARVTRRQREHLRRGRYSPPR